MDEIFIELCKEYHEKILKYLYYSVGNIEDARDLTQEVFIIVYNKMEMIKNHENIGGYIFQTAKYTANNFKRKRARMQYFEEQGIKKELASDHDIYEELAKDEDQSIDESRYIEDVMSMLQKDKRELYKLYYIDGLGYKDIAKKLHITEVAVRMKYMRLRKEIKKISAQIAKEKFVTKLYS